MHIERQVLFWIVMGLLLVLGIWVLKDVLLPFVAGLVIAYALNPLAERLTRIGLPRVAAAAVVVGLLLASLVLALVFLAPVLLAQIQQIAVVMPDEFERLKGLLDAWARGALGDRYADFHTGVEKATAELASNWAGLASMLAKSVWTQGLAVVNFFSLLLITPLVVFYLLADWPKMLASIDTWAPRDHEPAIRRLAGEINGAIAAFIRGQGLVCLILGSLYAIGLTWIGVSYGLLIGVATGDFHIRSVRRVGVGIDQRICYRRGPVLAGHGAAVQSAGLVCLGPGARCRVSFAQDRRQQDRAAPRVVDLRAVRIRLPVRFRRAAPCGSTCRGDPRLGEVRARALPRQSRLSRPHRHDRGVSLEQAR